LASTLSTSSDKARGSAAPGARRELVGHGRSAAHASWMACSGELSAKIVLSRFQLLPAVVASAPLSSS
jgi:hypothetical protein